MDGIDLLRAQALARRNARILAAKREYLQALREIRALASKLGLKQPGRPRKSDASGLYASSVARTVLREGQPLTLVELTIEVQARGCRTLDDPRKVAHAIRSWLMYRTREFRKDERGRWSTVID